MVAAYSSETRAWSRFHPDSPSGDPAPCLLMAHGAGAGADSEWMSQLTEALFSQGVSVVRFEFPYMQKRRSDGRKRPPDRMPVLLDCFSQQLEQLAQAARGPVFIGGKSMGGRVASMLAADAERVAAAGDQPAGVVCFGYPFHPPGNTERWRTGHFPSLLRPQLIIQGPRDPFGKRDEMSQLEQGLEQVQISWLLDGDHDFRPLKRSGLSQQDMIDEAARRAAAFMKGRGRGVCTD